MLLDVTGSAPPFVDSAGTLNRPASLENRFCRRPFELLEIHQDFHGFTCCPMWLPVMVGDAEAETIMGVWNGPSVREVRRSILDGSFQYCDKRLCPYMQANRLPPRSEILDIPLAGVADPTIVKGPPGELALCYDRSCNLACPSCRPEIHRVTRGPEYERRQRFTDGVLAFLDEHARDHRIVLRLTGSGDPFASPVFLDLIRRIDHSRHRRLRLALQTNGVMLTERLWQSLGPALPCVDSVSISIDAATESTYARVRRFGSWTQLQKNLRFLSQRRAAGELNALSLNFVVQNENFREMPAFVRMAEEIGNVTEVFFTMVLDWGSWSKEDFRQQSVWDTSHPNHGELLQVLRAPEFDHRIVHLGNLQDYRTQALARHGGTSEGVLRTASTAPAVAPAASALSPGRDQLLDHVRALREALRTSGAEFLIAGETLEAVVRKGSRYTTLRPRFADPLGRVTLDLAQAHERALAFAGWLPYGLRSWPLATDRLQLERHLERACLPAVGLRREAGSCGEGVLVHRTDSSPWPAPRGPYRLATDRVPELHPGEYYAPFIEGELLTAWFWEGLLVRAELEPMPCVEGDGRSTAAELLARRAAECSGSQARPDASVESCRAMLRYHGSSPATVLPEGVRMVVDVGLDSPLRYPWERREVSVQADRDHRWLPTLREAGKVLHTGIPEDLRAGALFAVDGVVDRDGQLRIARMRSDPVVPAAVYPAMVSSLFASSSG